MPHFRMCITQECKVTRTILLEVEAESYEEAAEICQSGEEAAPEFEDPRWKEYWDLLSEHRTVLNDNGK